MIESDSVSVFKQKHLISSKNIHIDCRIAEIYNLLKCNMSLYEDPPFIGDWHRQKKLGSGGFGVVTLWKNQKTQQCVGKYVII